MPFRCALNFLVATTK